MSAEHKNPRTGRLSINRAINIAGEVDRTTYFLLLCYSNSKKGKCQSICYNFINNAVCYCTLNRGRQISVYKILHYVVDRTAPKFA